MSRLGGGIIQMNIEIIQQINRSYYEEYYADWLKNKSKFKKYQKVIGIVLMILGLFLGVTSYVSNNSLHTFTVTIHFLGILMLFDFYYVKQKWIKERLKSKQNNLAVKIAFDDEKMSTISEFGISSLQWSFFRDAIKTEKGLILVPENGISIYIQQSVLKEKYIDEIVEKVKSFSTTYK